MKTLLDKNFIVSLPEIEFNELLIEKEISEFYYINLD
jgi:hypothetical protein